MRTEHGLHHRPSLSSDISRTLTCGSERATILPDEPAGLESVAKGVNAWFSRRGGAFAVIRRVASGVVMLTVARFDREGFGTVRTELVPEAAAPSADAIALSRGGLMASACDGTPEARRVARILDAERGAVSLDAVRQFERQVLGLRVFTNDALTAQLVESTLRGDRIAGRGLARRGQRELLSLVATHGHGVSLH
jgi:hypothetical protein